jgi:putative transposase
LDASAALWNEINYQRLIRYNDEDGFEGDVWDADTGALEGTYKGVLGASTAQTHNFWAFKQFTERLACTAEEYGIAVEVRSEAWTSQECPQCGSTDRTTRHQDTLTCPCGFEGHADLTASETFLKRQTEKADRPMARPVRFEWDDHTWSGTPHPHERPKEQRTDPSTVHRDGNVASGESA